jgi:hypothetical protein
MEEIINLVKEIDLAKEWLGLLASFVLIISFTFKDIVKFRVVNCCAALLWTVFGLDMNSISIIITNVFIIGLNLKHLGNDLKLKKELLLNT